MMNRQERLQMKSALNNDQIFNSPQSFMKNFHLGLRRETNNIGNILLVNTNIDIDITKLFSENKLLTIEVINQKLKELLDTTISFDFFIKIVFLAENKLNNLKSDIPFAETEEIIKNRWIRMLGLKKQNLDMQLDMLLYNIEKVFSNRFYTLKKELQKEIYKLLGNYMGEFIDSFISSYQTSEVMNDDMPYWNVPYKLDNYQPSKNLLF